MEYAYIFAIIFLSGFVQGLTGFGSVLIALPLLTLFLPIRVAVPLICLVGMSINIILFIKLRHNVRWSVVKLFIVGAIPGTLVGAYLLVMVSATMLHVLLGTVLVWFAMHSLLSRGRMHYDLGKTGGVIAGVLSGCLNGAIGAGGPPIILYTSLQDWPKEEIKGTIIGFFLFAGVSIIFTHAAYGLYSMSIAQYYIFSLPALLVGIWAGEKSYGSLSPTMYHNAVCFILLLMGIISLSKPMEHWIRTGGI